jgi:hypothetical protein
MGCAHRIHSYELPIWEPESVVYLILERINEILQSHTGELVVFTGDDRIMFDLDRALAMDAKIANKNISLIGYDGIVTNGGRYLAVGCSRAIATLDARPNAQGRAAARLLREIYEGRRGSGYGRVLVEPSVVKKPSW